MSEKKDWFDDILFGPWDIDLYPWKSDDGAGSMDYLLDTLGKVQAEAAHVAAPLLADVKLLQEKMERVMLQYKGAEAQIKKAISHCLEHHVEGEKHDSDVGTAQIVRPKNRISYDTKGLETLRLSFGDVDGMIGHLRKESPSKPYLKVKLK